MRLFFPILIFILLGEPLSAQENNLKSQADSLRLIEQYEEEFELRKAIGPPVGFDYMLAQINHMIENDQELEAKTLLDNLDTNSPQQTYFKTRALAHYYRYMYEPEKAISILSSADVQEYSLESASIQLNLSRYYGDMGKRFESLKHLEKSKEIFNKIGQSDFYLNGIVLSDLAFAYSNTGDETRTIEYGEKALNLYLENYPGSYRLISTFFNNLIMYLISYGDSKRTEDHLRAYENYMKTIYPEMSGQSDESESYIGGKALYLLSRVRTFSFLEKPEKALVAIHDLEEFFKNPNPWFNRSLHYLSAGIELVHEMYRSMSDYPNALKYAELITKYENAPYNQMKKYGNLALTHYYSDQHQLALDAVNKSLNAMKLPKDNGSLQTLTVLKAEMLAKLGRYQEAKAVLDEIFGYILDEKTDFDKININEYPTLVNQTTLKLFTHAGWVYQTKYLEGNKSEGDYRTSRDLALLAASVFENLYRKGFYNNNLGKSLNEIKDGLYFQPENISNHELINDLNLLERISNAHLWGRFSSKYIENLNLPHHILDRKNELTLKRSLLSRNYEMEVKNRKELKLIEEELANIEEDLKEKFPEYSFISSSEFDVSDLQEKLSSDVAVIKYSVGQQYVYAHYITKDEIILKNLGKSDTLENIIKQYLKDIKNIKHQFENNQEILATQLIQPFETTHKRKLIIVPEGFIRYVPFETLVSPDVIISYNFNLKSITHNIPGLKSYTYDFAGFVPIYSDHTEVNPLKYSIKELDHIKKLFRKDKIFKNLAAKKESFLKSLGKYKIFHLAMHSEMNEDNYEESSLIFSNMEKLYFWELYALNIPSEMVVLSACNTGMGKYINGEGVMSLARALNYAGVKSTVSCLWEVSDKESADLMGLFYEFLLEGKPKDEALSLAKLKFKELYPMKTHPYYWAGFVLTGDSEPLDLKRSSRPYIWLMVVAVVLVIGGTLTSRRKSLKF